MWERLVTAGCAALIIGMSSVVAAARTPEQTPSVIVCVCLSPKLGLEPVVAKRLLLEVHSIWSVLGAEIRSAEAPMTAAPGSSW